MPALIMPSRRPAGNASGNVHRSRHAQNADTIREMHLAFRRGDRAAINKVMKQQPAVFLKLLVLLVPCDRFPITDAEDAFGVFAREWSHEMADGICKPLRVTPYGNGHFVIRAHCDAEDTSIPFRPVQRCRLFNSGLEIRDARPGRARKSKPVGSPLAGYSADLRDRWRAQAPVL
jgi:hypothetical protein